MTAETLETYVMNDRELHDRITSAVASIRRQIDHAAACVAAENAEWADDPEWEHHAEFHASADVQFPAEVRDEAALSLFNHYLTELGLSRKART